MCRLTTLLNEIKELQCEWLIDTDNDEVESKIEAKMEEINGLRLEIGLDNYEEGVLF